VAADITRSQRLLPAPPPHRSTPTVSAPFDPTGPGPAGRGTSRRRLLIGAALGVATVAGGGVAALLATSGDEPAGATVVRALGEDDGITHAHSLDTDGSALYLAINIDGSALCSLTLPDPPG
jgi:hypothetical protein